MILVCWHLSATVKGECPKYSFSPECSSYFWCSPGDRVSSWVAFLVLVWSVLCHLWVMVEVTGGGVTHVTSHVTLLRFWKCLVCLCCETWLTAVWSLGSLEQMRACIPISQHCQTDLNTAQRSHYSFTQFVRLECCWSCPGNSGCTEAAARGLPAVCGFIWKDEEVFSVFCGSFMWYVKEAFLSYCKV